jgi:hypothetical protein
VYKSKELQTLAISSVNIGSESEDLDNDQPGGYKDLNSPMDDEQPKINMEVIVEKPVPKTKTKGGTKGKKKVTMPKLRDEIRAIRKEAPNPETGLRVQ